MPLDSSSGRTPLVAQVVHSRHLKLKTRERSVMRYAQLHNLSAKLNSSLHAEHANVDRIIICLAHEFSALNDLVLLH